MAEHVCPPWIGHLLVSPLRRLVQDPARILAPHLRAGMTALDAGCAMGFFSLAMAEMVGPEGRVYSVDLQQKMIDSLQSRARKAGLFQRIETRLCTGTELGIVDLNSGVDFALAFAVLHEVPERILFLQQIRRALRPEGRLLLAEPAGHVGRRAFAATLDIVQHSGLTVLACPRIWRSHTALCGRTRS
jgi:ubiquinone/menaquinone biosynthesis C-methylase UbiE